MQLQILLVLTTAASAALIPRETFELVAGAQQPDSGDAGIPDKIYEQLLEFSKFTQVSYCANYFAELNTGPLTCATDFCSEQSSNINVVKSFGPYVSKPGGFHYQSTGYIAVDNATKRIWVVWRGTLNIGDILDDIALWFTPWEPILEANKGKTCDDCHAHFGFYQLVKATKDEVFPVVDGLLAQYPNYRLYITGHSLGGATAYLSGLEFQMAGYNPLVVTLAGPKSGDAAMSAFADKAFDTASYYDSYAEGSIQELSTGYWRMTAVRDYVPLVPPGPSYTQAGLEFRLLASSPLPQPNNDVWYKGHYSYQSIFEDFTLNSSSLLDILHFNDHVSYLVSQSECYERELGISAMSVGQALPL